MSDPPAKTGRKRSGERQAFGGVIYQMQTGCLWNHLPDDFGDSSSVCRAFVRWEKKAIFDILWTILLTKCDDLQGSSGSLPMAASVKREALPKAALVKRGAKSVRRPQPV